MPNTYKDGKLDLQVCWNCCNYDSFGGVCLYHGKIVSTLDVCEKFDVDGYKEKVEGLENQIIELNNQIKMLKDDSYKLSCLESCGVDNWCGYGDAMEQYKQGEED